MEDVFINLGQKLMQTYTDKHTHTQSLFIYSFMILKFALKDL